MAIPAVTALGRITKAKRQFTALPDKLDRIHHRINGRLVSAKVYNREKMRGPGGRFGSRKSHISGLSNKGIAQQLMAEIGRPIGGGDWVSRVRKSSERFADMLANNNQLG